MKSSEVRSSFLSYFEQNGHKKIASSSLLPAEDPTLLFTNAGMNQFKSVFTGEEKRNYKRATTSQRCVRAGGKHNDLEQVGRTARHHTFFEMLGNFSFGDYFKEDAIFFAYELLVKEWKLDKNRLIFTVFGGGDGVAADDEARALWRKIAGVSDDKILSLGIKDNFWSMGDTGPCGPCSEIHYHLGDHFPCEREAIGKKCLGPACDCDRWNEIWNLVFMQYERSADGTMKPLPAPSIDTGMGLERVSSVLQGHSSNYDTDLFSRLISAISDKAEKKYGVNAETDVSIRVISDHIRASSFLIGDGIYASNEGRGYVLRRIMRRMIRHGRLLGMTKPFAFELVPILAEEMGSAHPVLSERLEIITDAIRREEELFLTTLDRGMNLLETEMRSLPEKKIPGRIAFLLYDTYGFPPDLTALIAESKGYKVDEKGFEEEMSKQRERSKEASDFSAKQNIVITHNTPTEFVGYTELKCEAILLETVSIGEGLYVFILDRTPFYAESGGQIGDSGNILFDDCEYKVETAKKTAGGVYLHFVKTDLDAPECGSRVIAKVDRETRLSTERNHTSTHLLHAALRKILGEHVQQAGSYVGPDRLRFDFSHFKAMTEKEIAQVEAEMNAYVIENLPVSTKVYPIDEAKKLGAMAFFGDKYGELVRVVSVQGTASYLPDNLTISREFCGGCHVRRVGEIGMVKIISETAVSSGMRRIEAVTGSKAVEEIIRSANLLVSLSKRLSTPQEELPARIEKMAEEQKKSEKELSRQKAELAMLQAEDKIKTAIKICGSSVMALVMEELDPGTLRNVSDRLIKAMGSGIVVMGSQPSDEDGNKKAALVVQVSKDLTSRIKAGEIVNRLARICGGGGGGRPDMAQAGGKDALKVPVAISAVPEIIKELLG